MLVLLEYYKSYSEIKKDFLAYTMLQLVYKWSVIFCDCFSLFRYHILALLLVSHMEQGVLVILEPEILNAMSLGQSFG
jgi:hypothetical protein